MIRLRIPQILPSVLILLVMTAFVTAEVPPLINYQGQLTDDIGDPVNGSALLKFKIYGSPSGNDSLWSSGLITVPVSNGLFNVQLGSSMSFPDDLFTGNDNRYLGITVSGDAELQPRTQFITVPYAYHALRADSAAYASNSPGAGAWVDDGSVVRLTTSTDRVGIGTSTASERLVVNKDIGYYGMRYIVSGSNYLDDVCGFKMGFSSDNHTTLEWNGDGAKFAVHTREGGVNYYNTLIANAGNVGIGTTTPSPSALLTVGDDISAFSANMITVGDADPTGYAGISFGQDADNRGWIAYDNEDDYLYLGTKENGTFSPSRICSKEGNVGIGIVPDSNKCLQIDRSVNLDPAENFYGVLSDVTSSNNNGNVYGGYFSATNGAFATTGIEAQAHPNNAYVATGVFASVSGTATYKYGIYGSCETSNCNYGVYSLGNLHSTGSNTKAAGGYKIDHPQDPENLYLMHSDVSSPEQKNVYDGTIVTDTDGNAVVELPSYFESLNENYRYQLTVIGSFAQAIISEKINGNRFSIKTDKPNIEVCWMVTGIRKDAFAKSALIDIEVVKDDEERGLYQNPGAFGLGVEKSVDYKILKSLENRDSSE